MALEKYNGAWALYSQVITGGHCGPIVATSVGRLKVSLDGKEVKRNNFLLDLIESHGELGERRNIVKN